MGKTLVCDCDADELCEADVLAGMVFEITCPDAAAPHPRAAGMPPRRIVRGPKRWQRAYRGFAGDNSCGFVGRFLDGDRSLWWRRSASFSQQIGSQASSSPMIEDLINRQPFTTEHSPILDTDLQFAAYMHA